MKLTIEIDDDEIRRVLAPWLQLTPPPEPQSPTNLLTVREVAERLGVGRSKAYSLLMSGEIESLSIGRSRRVSPAALAAFISKPPVEPEPVRFHSQRTNYSPPHPSRTASPPMTTERAPRRRAKELRKIDPLTKTDVFSWDEVQ